MKKSFIFLCIIFLSSSVFAEFKQFSVSVEPIYGLMNGSIEESVTYFDDNDVRTYESRLDWDVKNIMLYGATVSFDLYKYLNLNITAVKGISGASGNMQDYDWLNPFTTAWLKDDPEELTNYSFHNNTLNNYSKINYGIGANIYLPAKITLIPKLAYTTEYIKMTGSGGYYTYKTYNWEKIDFPEDQKVISYEQALNSFLFGLSTNIETIPHTFISLDFSIAPKMASIEALDTHLARNVKFNDKLYDALDLEGAAKACYLFNNNFGIGVKGFVQYIPNVFGADWVGYGSYWAEATEEGGSNRFLWSVQLSGFIRY